MKKNRYRLKSFSEKRHDYLLKGLAFCHQCGDRLVGKSANGVGGKFFYYERGAQVKRQAFLNKKFFSCQPLRFRAGPIDSQIWEEILKVMLEPKNAEEILKKAENSFKDRGNIILCDKIKIKIKGVTEQIDALSEHLSKVPQGVSPDPIFNQMRKLQGLKETSEGELVDLLSHNDNFDPPAALRTYKGYLKALRGLRNSKNDTLVKAKIINKLVYKVEIKKEGFKLHLFVGENHLAANKWEIEQELKPTGSDGEAQTAKPHFFKLLSSQTLTNGAHGQNRTGTSREEPRILSPVRLPIPPHSKVQS
jgi:hypothetical protein